MFYNSQKAKKLRKHTVTIFVAFLSWMLGGLPVPAGAVPALDWTATFSRTTGGGERYRASTTDALGNTYVVYQDVFSEARLVKFGATGAILSDVVLEVQDPLMNTFTAMTVDSTGDVFIGGMLFSLVTSRDDLWVAKFDTAGNLLWPSPMVYDVGFDADTYGVATDTSGNVIVAGTYQKISDTGSIVVKYGSSGGAPLWAQTIDFIEDDFWYDVTTDGVDNVYLIGAYETGGIIYPTITKYDASGVVQYDWFYPFFAGDSARAIQDLEAAALELPEASEIQNHLGLAYEAAGREEHALAAFREAVALDCDNQPAQHNLSWAELREERRIDAARH